MNTYAVLVSELALMLLGAQSLASLLWAEQTAIGRALDLVFVAVFLSAAVLLPQ